MLFTAVPYKAVFIRASCVDRQYTCLPTDDEWKFAEDVVERLRLFNDITALFSRIDYVTANVYFTRIAKIRNQIRLWSSCGNPLVEAMSANMVAKFDKYWTDIQGLMGIATILDPRFKTAVLLICYEDLLDVSGRECEDRVADVKNLLTDLMNENHVAENIENNESLAPSIGNSDNFLSDISARIASRRPTSMGFKSELDWYLDEEMVNMQTKNFNVLDWWKVAGTQFPTLRRIARDIYAIPVTTVASEAAFSTSGRVLIDDKTKQPATFWSCLQDIQEGLQELAL
ncbi:zinc finger BED domain-containing protein RICESLEEPER 1-like [Panicum hallii]|uniref:zinc finger BED domain-containing protein RICESLEEPER 1-like n=1 Tax=Panicum hallii TaxID=206008 RepID=UPI000DF4D494|nr:zinc finger BED domain-containing protein RICESLEEPER 1-like [Panicum hallii]